MGEYADLSGVRTYYEAEGAEGAEGDGEPLVLLHGGFCTAGSRLAVVPGASHLVPLEQAGWVNRLVLEHLTPAETGTMLPVRRAPAAPGG
ncbi:hypothetical protein [Streptomyces sp. 184]|uniref:hypothetical protein n=1 Tax=Streptomyces sp. 184 TaxID=1827526 RepID=UPI0038913ACC